MLVIINDAAQAYRGIIPDDCCHDPYMRLEELGAEIRDGVEFWGVEERGELVAVGGLQDRGDVALIRHAYVRTAQRNRGLGSRLLRHLHGLTDKPILVGTWTAASWAIGFYEKNGYVVLSREETDRLLRRYWTLPERQITTSTVLRSHRSCARSA